MGMSGVLMGSVQSEGKKREEAGGARGAARVRPLIGALGRLVRMRARAEGGRRRRGIEAWRAEDVEEHRLA